MSRHPLIVGERGPDLTPIGRARQTQTLRAGVRVNLAALLALLWKGFRGRKSCLGAQPVEPFRQQMQGSGHD